VRNEGYFGRFAWRLLEAYGRFKYRHLLPIYRLFGLIGNGTGKALTLPPGASRTEQLERNAGQTPSPQQGEAGPQHRSGQSIGQKGSPIFYHRPHGQPCHGITAEVIEDFNKLCAGVIANRAGIRFSKPHNITLLTYNNYKRRVLIEECYEAYGINDYVVLAKEIAAWDWSAKIRPVLDYLESGMCGSDYLVATDSDDILMVNDPSNIITLFETYSCDALFCNTFLDWPANREYREFEAQRYYTHQFHSHLSAGGYVARRGALIKFLREIKVAFEEKSEWALDGGVFNDQLAWRHLHYKYYPLIKVDFRCLIFQRYDLFIDYD
jgi:hypothetical protein